MLRGRGEVLSARFLSPLLLCSSAPLLFVLAAACASKPPIPGRAEILANPRARLSGVVLEARTGQPVVGIRVWAIPHRASIPWPPPATTDSEGRFFLILYAPGEYSFMFERGGRTVISSDPDDPSRQTLSVSPGAEIGGVAVRLRSEVFERIR